jgi:hypothetical protein
VPGNPDFAANLRAAVDRARANLGTGFNFADKRANAYLDIAGVLRDEYQRTNDQRLLKAAHQLEEQAEITTYSGFNGRAALVGNYAAMINNPSLYNVPLDVFSWQIDHAVVEYFDNIVRTGRYDDISAQNINAVDGLVWASKGMIQSFPGTALGIDYSIIPADSPVWSAYPISSQLRTSLSNQSFGTVSYGFNGGGRRRRNLLASAGTRTGWRAVLLRPR